MPTPQKKSVLSNTQRRKYTEQLADGVPEAVIAEFDARLTTFMRKWERDLRRGIAREDAHVILWSDDDA
jgi:hypothetical protein